MNNLRCTNDAVQDAIIVLLVSSCHSWTGKVAPETSVTKPQEWTNRFRTKSSIRMRWMVLVSALAAVDCRKHRYGHAAPTKAALSTTDKEPPPPVAEEFLRNLVHSFKTNEEAESLVLPSSMSRSERRLVHIYAAREGLGHKSMRGSGSERTLTLRKDDAWVKRRKQRLYLAADLQGQSEDNRPERNTGFRQECPWIVALTAYYAFVH